MSEQLAAQTVLAEVDAVRRRARADRHAYWPVLLYFALAHLVAVPLYRWRPVTDAPVELDDGSVLAWYGPDPDRVGTYWLGALLLGGLLTVWWYRRRGRRVGVEGRVVGAVIVAVVAVIGYTVLRLLPQASRVHLREFGALLVVAVGLLALARLERSRGLLAVAVLYSAAAVLANTYNMDSAAAGLRGGDGESMSLPALLLPGAILLVGGLAAAGRSGLAGLAGRGRR